MADDLAALVSEARAAAASAQQTFGHLTAEQLNWKPAPDAWSVAQCFDHLITINAGYFPIMQSLARGTYKPSWKTRLPLLPRLFGSLVLGAVQPQAKRKLKADPRFLPSSSAIGSDIIARFVSHQADIIAHMQKTAGVPLRKVIVTSPVASFVTYSLYDAYRIIVTHERRHMAQARRVMEHAQFPRA